MKACQDEVVDHNQDQKRKKKEHKDPAKIILFHHDRAMPPLLFLLK
jgi:hypothetical protein